MNYIHAKLKVKNIINIFIVSQIMIPSFSQLKANNSKYLFIII